MMFNRISDRQRTILRSGSRLQLIRLLRSPTTRAALQAFYGQDMSRFGEAAFPRAARYKPGCFAANIFDIGVALPSSTLTYQHHVG